MQNYCLIILCTRKRCMQSSYIVFRFFVHSLLHSLKPSRTACERSAKKSWFRMMEMRCSRAVSMVERRKML